MDAKEIQAEREWSACTEHIRRIALDAVKVYDNDGFVGLPWKKLPAWVRKKIVKGLTVSE